MNSQTTILITEDDKGHALLIEKNIKSVINNEIKHFHNGDDLINFLNNIKTNIHDYSNHKYLILLDIRMPKVDGMEVLRTIKNDSILKNIPIIIVTTTDEPKEIALCHELGCNNYITKPIDYDKFIECIQNLGNFIKIMQIPNLVKL